MELQCGEPNRRTKNRKITLEEFLDFTESHKQLNLTINHLNQIIDMHGFKKIHCTQKNVLLDAVNSIDLMNPSRSTLKDDNVSSCAFISLEEAVKHLAELNWQECSVTSLQTLNSVSCDLSLHNADASASKSKRKSSSRSRKKVPRSEGVDGNIITATTGSVPGSETSGCVGRTQSACSSAVGDECAARNPAPNKRKAKDAYGVSGRVGGTQSACSFRHRE